MLGKPASTTFSLFTLEFTHADLQANREGRLSNAQRQRLDADLAQFAKSTWGHLKWMALLMLGLLLFTLLLFYYEAGWAAHEVFAGENLLGLGVMSIGFTLVWGAGALYSRRTLYVMRKGRLYQVEGQARVWVGYVRYSRVAPPALVYQVVLGRGFSRKVFRFAGPASLAHFEDGQHYRAYYVRFLMPVILSLEALPHTTDP